MLILIFTFRIM